MNNRPRLADYLDHELIDVPQFADVFDFVGQDVRDWLRDDPGRLPTPLYFRGQARWPWQQLRAWVKAGEPRDYPHPATDFVPAEITRFADNPQREEVRS